MLIFLLISFIILYLCHSILISKPKKNVFLFSFTTVRFSVSLSLGFHLIYVIPYLSLNPKKMYSYSPSLQYVSLSLSLSLSLYGSTSMDRSPAAEKATAASCISFFSNHFALLSFFFFLTCVFYLWMKVQFC